MTTSTKVSNNSIAENYSLKDLPNEIWIKIIGYENLYSISSLGRVKSHKRKSKNRNGLISIKEKILKQNKRGRGYYCVNLSKNGFYKTFNIHVLVAIHFLNHNPNGWELVVNHKDLNKENNCVSNLEIITTKENTRHYYKAIIDTPC